MKHTEETGELFHQIELQKISTLKINSFLLIKQNQLKIFCLASSLLLIISNYLN
jgi:hypothetical protein